ncbi:hypothetical protein VCRA2116O30_50011 [Vibrio crassostreae]|nr:hypothetical protein VCRA2118O41_10011 [Vibrio crassostreae]CAK1843627.1 hypothetical protein VCRA2117O37_10011 [Vibrio crassostreae]CAK1844370.1 hypothetical protein VCRA2116O31_10011 [Vibrio crassostreae]CAK2028262.1 hypothetical protein VCRA2113O20_20470 [Vibrio crassostreae]CAK2144461.1 hypothetical protein VCRA2116O26_40350 [Vibrio crassostreae]
MLGASQEKLTITESQLEIGVFALFRSNDVVCHPCGTQQA